MAGTAHPQSCRLLRAGPPAVTAGQTALLRFESCDKRGNRCADGGDPFEVRLEADPSAPGVELPCLADAAAAAAVAADAVAAEQSGEAVAAAPEITPDVVSALATRQQRAPPPPPTLLDELSGVYTLGYGWSCAGGLRLSIRLYGFHIAGSPFNLAVLPDQPHAGHSVPYGDNLRLGVTDQPLRIGLLLRDRFGNPCDHRLTS